MITCYRRQFAVGQGGLHFGIIKYPYEYMGIKSYNRFAYLYDCGCSGGKKDIQECINFVVSELYKLENLNYFYIFISHVHSDHINGLPLLVERIQNLNIPHQPVFVLPYMTEAEKLIQIGGLSFEDDEYGISFLENPRNIIPDDFDIQYLSDIEAAYVPLNIPSYNIPEPNLNGILSHNDRFQFGILNNFTWVLSPYYYRIKHCLLRQLNTELNNANITLNNFRQRDYLRKLRAIYMKYRCNLNLSSLCLYSGTNMPVNHLHTGWLHTGDINFFDSNAFAGFINHYDNFADNVRVMQIPHHGSKQNSELKHFEHFHNIATLFITTSANTNGYGIPNVSSEYLDSGHILLLTEDNRDIWSFEKTNGIIWSNFA